VNFGTSVTFTATVASTAGTPPGVVTFYDGTTAIGTGQLSGASPNTATFTTSSLAAGTHSITASYNASMYFNASTSSAISQNIGAFTVSAPSNVVLVNSGRTGFTNIGIATVGAYSGTVSFACGTLPANVRCNFAPATITFTGVNSSVSTSLEIYASASSSAVMPDRPGTNAALRGVLACALLPLFGFAAFRRRSLLRLTLLIMLFGATAFGLSGCGNSATTSGGTPAAPGSYTVPVTATAGALTSTVNLTLIIQ
jgi:hypothetical protein